MARKIRKISRVKTISNSLSKQFMLRAVHVIAEKIVDEEKRTTEGHHGDLLHNC
jgi:hypothetical protein